MKNRILTLLLTLGVLLANCFGLCAAPKTLKGNGRLVTKEILLKQSFSAVSASRSVKVKLVAAPAGKIGIEADENVIDHVLVETKGNTLRLTIDPAYTSVSNISVTVTVPTDGRLTDLEASSAAKIIAEPVIRSASVGLDASSAAVIEATVEAESCELEASSSARIRASVKGGSCDIDASSAAVVTATLAVEQCKIELTSAANARLTGAALRCSVEASSAAKLDADAFAVKRCSAKASSAAKLSLCCLEVLDANASSGSTITYQGNCSLESRKSSGGRISKK